MPERQEYLIGVMGSVKPRGVTGYDTLRGIQDLQGDVGAAHPPSKDARDLEGQAVGSLRDQCQVKGKCTVGALQCTGGL